MISLTWSALAGVGLGSLYFGGLWLTVRGVYGIRYPALVFVASFVARTCLVVFGLFLLTGGGWQRVVAALLGILLARALFVRVIRSEVHRGPES